MRRIHAPVHRPRRLAFVPSTVAATVPGMTSSAPDVRTDPLALLGETRLWHRLADDLEAARRAIDAVPVDPLGSRVAPVARAVLDAWADRVLRLTAAAADHADGVRLAGDDIETVDALTAAGLRGMPGAPS